MTIIIAVKFGDEHIEMASDTRLCGNSHILSDDSKKIFEIENGWVGCAGDYQIINLFINFLTIEGENVSCTNYEHWYFNMLKKFWYEHGLPLTSNDVFLETIFVSCKPKIYQSYNCSIFNFNNPFHEQSCFAIGRGREIALGAMSRGGCFNAREIIEVVCKHINECGGKPHVFYINKNGR